MTTAKEAVEAVHSAIRTNETRACRRAEAGKTVLHQGDVYLHAVPRTHDHGDALGTRQVAVGTTIGARHVAAGEAVTVYAGKKYPDYFRPPIDAGNELLGPLIIADGPWTLTHPEHAHHEIHDTSVAWQVTYQYDRTTRRAVND